MKAKLVFTIISLLLIMVYSGAVGEKDKAKCSAIVEGFCFEQVIWTKDRPALIIKDKGSSRVLFGELLEVTDDGIRFDPRREGLHNPPAKLYSSQEILCAIDKDGQIFYGNLPVEFGNFWRIDFHLVSATRTGDKPIVVKLKPNQRFSFCLEPDIYVIKKIAFMNRREEIDKQNKFKHTFNHDWKYASNPADYIDETIDIPTLTFTVARDSANYIGDLYFTSVSTDSVNVCELHFRRGDRRLTHPPTSEQEVWPFTRPPTSEKEVWRPPFEGTTGTHTLKIKVNDKFSPEAKLPLKVSVLQFSPNQTSRKE